jgi:hypothetical protein
LQGLFSVHHLPVQECVPLGSSRLNDEVTRLLPQLIVLARCAKWLLLACSKTSADRREEAIAIAYDGSELRSTFSKLGAKSSVCLPSLRV